MLEQPICLKLWQIKQKYWLFKLLALLYLPPQPLENGDPQADNILEIIKILQANERVKLWVEAQRAA